MSRVVMDVRRRKPRKRVRLNNLRAITGLERLTRASLRPTDFAIFCGGWEMEAIFISDGAQELLWDVTTRVRRIISDVEGIEILKVGGVRREGKNIIRARMRFH